MIECVIEVIGRDVDHQKYRGNDPTFYSAVIPLNESSFGLTHQGYVTLKIVRDDDYKVTSEDDCNIDGIIIEIICMTRDLCIVLRKHDGTATYLPDDNICLDPVHFLRRVFMIAGS